MQGDRHLPLWEDGFGGGDGLLRFAAQSGTRLDDLLHCLLEGALSLSSSDAAACQLTLGEEVAREPWSKAVALNRTGAGIQGERLQRWAREAWTARRRLEPRKPHHFGELSSEAPELRLTSRGSSALLVPMLDGSRFLGLLHLESNERHHYGPAQIKRLRNLAGEAIPAVCRVFLREHLRALGSGMDLVGVSPALCELDRQLLAAARHGHTPVLITGERGSGKEVAAWAIHCWSRRCHRPFVPVLLAGLPDNLVADELFGHEKNSFTGAEQQRPGKFEAAAGGTVFLDEIGDLSPAVQASLLRIIERGELSRIGSDLPARTESRVIAATNHDLQKAMREGRFRRDLYDRLTVFEVEIPPLRDRREDIPLLAEYFLKRYCSELERSAGMSGRRVCGPCGALRPVACVGQGLYEALESYDWPGNVRELKNLIYRLVATVQEEVIGARHLPERFRPRGSDGCSGAGNTWNLDTAIRTHIEKVLERTDYNKSKAARLLGIPYTTLQSKMKKLGIRSRPHASG